MDDDLSIVPISLMHEQSIVASLLTLALKNAEIADARKIVSIHLVVGDYTGVVEDAVNFYFDFLSQDTIAAGAKINYTHVAGQLRCRDCDVLFPCKSATITALNAKENESKLSAGGNSILKIWRWNK
jgi:hydrogenase nickel incorporation protein HypA/HybF